MANRFLVVEMSKKIKPFCDFRPTLPTYHSHSDDLPQPLCPLTTTTLPTYHSRSAHLPQPLCQLTTATLPTYHIHSDHLPQPLCQLTTATLPTYHSHSADLPNPLCRLTTATLPTYHSHSADLPQPLCQLTTSTLTTYHSHSANLPQPLCRLTKSTLPTYHSHSADLPQPLCQLTTSTLTTYHSHSANLPQSLCPLTKSTLPTYQIHSADLPQPLCQPTTATLPTYHSHSAHLPNPLCQLTTATLPTYQSHSAHLPNPLCRLITATLPTYHIHSDHLPQPLCQLTTATLPTYHSHSADLPQPLCPLTTSTLITYHSHSANLPQPLSQLTTATLPTYHSHSANLPQPPETCTAAALSPIYIDASQRLRSKGSDCLVDVWSGMAGDHCRLIRHMSRESLRLEKAGQRQAGDSQGGGNLSPVSTASGSLSAPLLWQGYTRSPRSLGARVVVCFWWFYVLIFLIMYIASMTNYLRVGPTPSIIETYTHIQSIDDLANQDDIDFGVIKGGSTEVFFAENELDNLKKAYKKMLHHNSFVSNLESGIAKVRKPKPFALIAESAMAKYYTKQKPCDLYMVGDFTTHGTYSLAFPLNFNATFVRNINMAIVKLRESGKIKAMEDRWFTGECKGYLLEQSTDNKFHIPPFYEVDLGSFSGALIILGLGLILGSIVTALEICLFKFAEASEKEDEEDREKLNEEKYSFGS
ncbi:Glutamate receptor 3 [Bulinus truncatus]|nr:Glutamate receptor 3 [Bulinus truncatus]